jgi:membrane protease YdiL (CAAX protease family)
VSATLATLLLAMAGPPTLVVVSRRAFGESPALIVQFVLHLVFCAIAAAVVLVVVRVERQPLSSIGLRRPGWSTLVFGSLVALVTLVVLPWATRPLTGPQPGERVASEIRTLSLWPIWFRAFVGATAGVVEETLYRGYAVERLAALTRRRWLGALLALMGFTLAHVPAWGLRYSLAADLPFAIVMTLFYLWRRDLAANALAHSTGLVVMLTAIKAP